MADDFMDDGSPMRGSRPVPDPTILTTQQLTFRVNALRELIEARLDGMDKAIILIQNAADAVPSKTDIAVAQLKDLHNEKFISIEKQFKERDHRAAEAIDNSKLAVDAALAAQKEAIGKTEASFTKQIDEIKNLMNTFNKTLDDKINDCKQRITTIETFGKGGEKIWGYLVGLAGIGFAAVAFFAHRGGP